MLEARETAIALGTGVAFGAILQRAGLGDSRVIRGQLNGTDYTVVLVMFGAICTAMLGVLWADALGWMSWRTLAMPPTDLVAQALGAIVFGGGFGIAALCPGTACVAAASGRRDGLSAVAGVFVGTIATPLVWPAFAGAILPAPDEGRRLTADLGLPAWGVATIIVALATVGAMLARRASGSRDGGAWWQPRRLEIAGLTLAMALAVAGAGPRGGTSSLTGLAAAIEREEDHVEPIALARWIHDGKQGLRIIDLRDGLDDSTYIIPGASPHSLQELTKLEFSPDELVVLYSDGGAHAAQGWVLLQMRGVTNARVLHDGMAGWEDEVLSPVAPPATDTAAAARFRPVRELSLWFGGRPLAAGIADAFRDPSEPRGRRRRRTC
ncbi:MAG: YeeE/YedE family protein [Gemmatimonadetes bacterium]|nr:YeeE/YedE family protein [Gemmatimonadota bacterium]